MILTFINFVGIRIVLIIADWNFNLKCELKIDNDERETQIKTILRIIAPIVKSKKRIKCIIFLSSPTKAESMGEFLVRPICRRSWYRGPISIRCATTTGRPHDESSPVTLTRGIRSVLSLRLHRALRFFCSEVASISLSPYQGSFYLPYATSLGITI